MSEKEAEEILNNKEQTARQTPEQAASQSGSQQTAAQAKEHTTLQPESQEAGHSTAQPNKKSKSSASSAIHDAVSKKTAKMEKRHEEAKNTFGVAFQVFLRDIKRVIINPVAIVVFIGIIVLPCLYAWLGIAAHWDPYANTSNVSVGVVNEDAGADNKLAGHINIGDTLVNKLKDNHQLGWQFYDSSEEAMKLLDTGQLYAVIVIPQDFSTSISNLFSDNPNKDVAHVTYHVNEREHAVTVKVTDAGASKVETQINQTFMSTVTKVVTEVVKQAGYSVSETGKSVAETIADRVGRAADTMGYFVTTVDELENVGQSTVETLNSTKTLIAEVNTECDKVSALLDDSLTKCTAARKHVTELLDKIPQEMQIIRRTLEDLNSTLDDCITSIVETKTTISDTKSMLSNVDILIDQTLRTIATTKGSTEHMKSALSSISSMLTDVQATLLNVSSEKNKTFVQFLSDMNPTNIAQFMSSPVTLVTTVINPIEKFGTGIAPFFTSLSLWIGGIVLIAVLHTEVQNLKKRKLTFRQAYLGRGLLFGLLGSLQGLVCTLGDLFVGVQCENPALFILTGMISGFVFVSMMFMVAASFKHMGKAFAILMVVIQIPGSSGMYPIEFMPPIIRAIHPFLPFTYSCNAFRECIIATNYGSWFFQIFILLVMLLITVIIGIYMGDALKNVNALFDKRLASTDIILCEKKDHKTDKKISSSSAVLMLDELGANDKSLKKKLKKLKKIYKYYKRKNVMLMVVVPLLFLVACSVVTYFLDISPNTKLILIFVWILLIAIADILIIMTEFNYVRLQEYCKQEAENKSKFAKKVEKKYDKKIKKQAASKGGEEA